MPLLCLYGVLDVVFVQCLSFAYGVFAVLMHYHQFLKSCPRGPGHQRQSGLAVCLFVNGHSCARDAKLVRRIVGVLGFCYMIYSIYT